MLERLKQKLYYYHRIDESDAEYEEGIDKFKQPEERKAYFKPISGEAVIVSGGELNKKRIVAKLSNKVTDVYCENDRMLLNEEITKEFDALNPQANYRIASVMSGHNITEVIAEQLLDNNHFSPTEGQ